MRYAIISDIHANIDALRAVLADAQDMKVEKIICLGDVLGYGPDPVPALEAVYSRAHVCLAGNHDDAVCGRCSTEYFNDFAAAAVSRQRRALAPEAIAWLKNLPYVCEMDGFACAHGDFSDPENFDYVQEAEEALPSWEARSEQLLFVGHTHQPGVYVLGTDGVPRRFEPVDFVLESDSRYLVNVGSVGYPRSGICRSSYCIYDGETRSVFFRSLPFDLEGYREKMGGKGLDEAPWMTARAAARAAPSVRAKVNFGRPSAASPRAKVLKVEHSEPRVMIPGQDSGRKPYLPILLTVVLLMVLGAAFVFYGMRGTPSSAGKAPPPETSRTEVALDSARKSTNGPNMAPAAVSKMVREPSTMVTNRTLKLSSGDDKVYFAVRLVSKSHPVRVRVAFSDMEGRLLSEKNFEPVKGRRMEEMPIPPGATSVALEGHRIERTGLSRFERFDIDVKELKGGKRQ